MGKKRSQYTFLKDIQMVNKYEKMLNILVTREMQITITKEIPLHTH